MEEILLSNSIVILYKAGVTSDGKVLTKRKRIDNIKTTSTNEDMFAVGLEISKLFTKEPMDILKLQEFSIMG